MLFHHLRGLLFTPPSLHKLKGAFFELGVANLELVRVAGVHSHEMLVFRWKLGSHVGLVLFLGDLRPQATDVQVAALVGHVRVQDIEHLAELVLGGLLVYPSVGDEVVVLLGMELEASLIGLVEEGMLRGFDLAVP